jgi:YVTN family beta-propeller protein
MKVWLVVLLAAAACEAPPAGAIPFAVNATLVETPPEGRIAAGRQPDGTAILPGGRRVSPAGRQVELGGFLLGVRLLPGGTHALTTDGGYNDEFLSLVDLASGAVVQRIPFRKDAGEALFLGLAVRADGRVFASGGGADRIHAYDYDPGDKTSPLSPAGLIALPDHSYVAGIAFADDTTLAAALQRAGALALIDTGTGDEIGRVDLGVASAPYDVAVAPGRREAYVSLWGDRAVAVVDLAGAAVVARVPVGKNPEALLLDPPGAPTRLLVASTDSDTISVIDLASRRVTRTVSLAAGEPARLGSAPNHLALAPGGARLYVANAGENCIDVRGRRRLHRLRRDRRLRRRRCEHRRPLAGRAGLQPRDARPRQGGVREEPDRGRHPSPLHLHAPAQQSHRGAHARQVDARVHGRRQRRGDRHGGGRHLALALLADHRHLHHRG